MTAVTSASRPLPSLDGLPFLGNGRALRRDPLGFFVRAAKRGDIVDLGVHGMPHVGIFGAESTLAVLMSPRVQEAYPDVEQVHDPRGQGVVTTSGEEQRRHRSMLQHSLAQRHIDAYHPAIIEAIGAGLDTWPTNGVLDAVRGASALTHRAQAALLFGADLGRDEALARALDVIVASQRTPLLARATAVSPFDLGAVRGRSFAEANAIVASRALAPRGTTNVASELRDARAFAMSDSELVANLLQLYLAGTDTVTTAVAWTLYCLLRAPEHLARATEESRAADPVLAPSKVPEGTHLERVVKESLRLFPTSPFGVRYTTAPVAVGEMTIPARSRVFYSPWVIHRDPRWHVDPERFEPARFAGPALARGTYIPFAVGPNACLGATLAAVLVRTCVMAVLRRFRLVADPTQEVGVRCAYDGSLRHTRPVPGIRLTTRRS